MKDSEFIQSILDKIGEFGDGLLEFETRDIERLCNLSTDRLVRLTKEHKRIMDEKNIIIWVYTNASGFLWGISKVDSGTDLGWSDFNGNCKLSGAFLTYEDALEDAISLINRCDLEQFRKETPAKKFHWGNYSYHLNQNYRK